VLGATPPQPVQSTQPYPSQNQGHAQAVPGNNLPEDMPSFEDEGMADDLPF